MTRSATSTFSLLAYGGPSAPLNILMLQLIVYIPPFYAQEMGLDLAAVGLVFFLARAWDAVIDPLVGSLSDNTRTRWGRRKPWVLVGTPVLMAATIAFCLPPENANLVYLGITAFVFYVALTVVQIPYLSWGAELSRDYRERTRIGSFREGGLMAGIVIGTGLPLFFFGTGNPSLREILTVFVVAILIMLPVTVLVALRVTPSAPHPESQPIRLRDALAAARRNKPLLRLLTGILCFWLGGSIYNALILFMVQFTLGLPNSAFLWLVFVQYILAIACLPVAVRIAHALGRHRALVLGGLGFFAILPLFMLVEKGSLTQALVLFGLAGTLTSFIWVMPPAMIADTVEYGMLKGGGDQAALYMALYLFAQKAALAAGVGIGMPLAGLLGFDPTNSDTAISGLNVTALVMPGIIGLIGGAVLFNYPIDARPAWNHPPPPRAQGSVAVSMRHAMRNAVTSLAILLVSACHGNLANEQPVDFNAVVRRALCRAVQTRRTWNAGPMRSAPTRSECTMVCRRSRAARRYSVSGTRCATISTRPISTRRSTRCGTPAAGPGPGVRMSRRSCRNPALTACRRDARPGNSCFCGNASRTANGRSSWIWAIARWPTRARHERRATLSTTASLRRDLVRATGGRGRWR